MVNEIVAKYVRFIGAVYQALLSRDVEPAELQKYANALLQGLPPIDFFETILMCEERQSQAKLFVAPGHFYSPIANPAQLHHHMRRTAQIGPDVAGVTIDRPGMVRTWQALLPFLSTCPLPKAQTPGFFYFSENLAYGAGDAFLLHAMLRHYRPKRLIEIGSGYSSAAAIDTIDAYLNGECEVTFIEPHPQRLRTLLGDRAAATRILDVPAQETPLGIFEELAPGDILFIDSTHVLRAGSDVCYELFEILPRLASGVVVHIHDMFWPFEYPSNWVLDENRSWNELYAVRTFLTENDRWKITFFSDYFTKFERPLIDATFPAFQGGASLWLERR